MKEKFDDEIFEDDNVIDGYSETSYERSPYESDEDYQERMEDLESYSDYYND